MTTTTTDTNRIAWVYIPRFVWDGDKSGDGVSISSDAAWSLYWSLRGEGDDPRADALLEIIQPDGANAL